jgi:hypothetical protein
MVAGMELMLAAFLLSVLTWNSGPLIEPDA